LGYEKTCNEDTGEPSLRRWSFRDEAWRPAGAPITLPYQVDSNAILELVAVADLDLDGDEDVVAISHHETGEDASLVMVYSENEDPDSYVARASARGSAGWAGNLVLLDVDGDSAPDAITSSSDSYALSLNRRDATFGRADYYSVDGTVLRIQGKVDIDGQGRPVLWLRPARNELAVVSTPEIGVAKTFLREQSFSPYGGADMNADGLTDIVLSHNAKTEDDILLISSPR